VEAAVDESPIVIIGGGAAGHSAAETLRREGYEGSLTLLSADPSPPYDRPNLSKDFLAGHASEDWMPLRPPEFYEAEGIELVLDSPVARVDTSGRSVITVDGRSFSYGRLLLALGAHPIQLDVPGLHQRPVQVLRTLADARSLIASLRDAKRVVVVGASFIGLEVAAALRARALEVHVVGADRVPFARVFGSELGGLFRKLHEQHGVVFHLGRSVARLEARGVVLDDEQHVEADVIVAGIGVRPQLALAEAAGLRIDRGVAVDRYLESSVPGVFAAGDIARWPDPLTGDSVRVEHWAVAQRQGQLAARNMLGRKQPCRIIPFFWSRQYDVSVHHVGHAESWDDVELDGELEARRCTLRYRRQGRLLAVATVGRALDALRAEAELEASLSPPSE
jgi:apoptosis-inducing factor 3